MSSANSNGIKTWLLVTTIDLCKKLHIQPTQSETEKYRKKEHVAALTIQTNWRMLRDMWQYKRIQQQSVVI